jgi:hypothetical protein
MILMGYDSSVFNSVQASENWKSAMSYPDAHMIGLINTVYTVGGIVTGWFLSGPTVRSADKDGLPIAKADMHGPG